MAKQLNFKWLSHIKDTDLKADFEKAVRNDSLVLSRLREILNEMEAEVRSGEVSFDQFTNPNWQYKVAFDRGDLARILKLKELLSFLEG